MLRWAGPPREGTRDIGHGTGHKDTGPGARRQRDSGTQGQWTQHYEDAGHSIVGMHGYGDMGHRPIGTGGAGDIGL